MSKLDELKELIRSAANKPIRSDWRDVPAPWFWRGGVAISQQSHRHRTVGSGASGAGPDGGRGGFARGADEVSAAGQRREGIRDGQHRRQSVTP